MLVKTEPRLITWANAIHPNCTAVVVVLSLLPMIFTTVMIVYWWLDNWQRHPLSRTLMLYTQDTVRSPSSWMSVASNVNTEFRRLVCVEFRGY